MNSQTVWPKYSVTSKMKRYGLIQKNDSSVTVSFYSPIRESYVYSSEDTIYTVELDCQYRPDLISLKFYDTTIFDWVLEDVNNIEDPIKDLKVGTKIFVPSRAKITYLIS